jgi:hypothetical protein
MKKIALATLATLAFTGSAMAYYATPGTVVGQPIIEVKGTSDGGVRELGAPSMPKKNYSVAAQSRTSDVFGRMRTNIQVKGWHNVAIYNQTKQDQSYMYTYELRCDNMYTKFSRNVTLRPQGMFSDTSETFGTVQENGTGTWPIRAETHITGNESIGHPSSATLHVTK